MTLYFKKLFSSKYKLVKQYDQIDCGPASLLSVLKFYGGNSSLVQLRELTNTSVNGSTMLDLVNAVKKIGFDAFGASGKYEDLMKEKMPCIAHVVVDEVLSHFVVVYKIYAKKLKLAIPAKVFIILAAMSLIKFGKNSHSSWRVISAVQSIAF